MIILTFVPYVLTWTVPYTSTVLTTRYVVVVVARTQEGTSFSFSKYITPLYDLNDQRSKNVKHAEWYSTFVCNYPHSYVKKKKQIINCCNYSVPNTRLLNLICSKFCRIPVTSTKPFIKTACFVTVKWILSARSHRIVHLSTLQCG